MKYHHDPQTSFGGIFSFNPIPTEKKFFNFGSPNGAISMGSPFTDEIDIPRDLNGKFIEFEIYFFRFISFLHLFFLLFHFLSIACYKNKKLESSNKANCFS
jgi:hypothetical protein